MSKPVILTKRDLRAREWTHADIAAFPHQTTVRTGKKGRPAFGYQLSYVIARERMILLDG
jgi:hypothetical protein